MMKILFVWTGVTSYMADCWRRLAAEPGVELKVIMDASSPLARSVAFDADEVMRGIDWCETGAGTALEGWQPDIVFAVGWHSKVVRHYVEWPDWKTVPKVCCFDMPWRWKLRCLMAPFVLGRFLKNYRAAFVPGEVCARYARWLGFKSIHKGLFAIDTGRFLDVTPRIRSSSSGILGEYAVSLRSDSAILGVQTTGYFLYVGRNSSEKRLEDIREAHEIYKKMGGKLELRMYGKGLDGGFVTPEEVPALMQGAAAFVLASDFDPWPLVLLEAMSAGCPIIASDRCTNRPELGKNWHVFKVGDVKALAKRMHEVEGTCGFGANDVTFDSRKENIIIARQYDCSEWVKRVMKIEEEVV